MISANSTVLLQHGGTLSNLFALAAPAPVADGPSASGEQQDPSTMTADALIAAMLNLLEHDTPTIFLEAMADTAEKDAFIDDLNTMKTIMSDETSMLQLVRFLSENKLGKPAATHPACVHFLQEAWLV